MAQADLLARLEAVTIRLEKIAAKGGGGGGGGGDGDEIPPYVAAYQSIVDNQLKNAVKAINDLGIPDAGQWLQQAFECVNNVIKACAVCKKPSDQELTAFLKSGIDAMSTADNARFKGKDTKTWGDHYKTIYEIINSIIWVTMAAPANTPKAHVEAQEQATDFNGNRVLKNKKDDKTKAFLDGLKALNKAQKEFVLEYFKIQLEWNPKGGDLKSFDSKSAKASVKAAPKEEDKKKDDDKKKDHQKKDDEKDDGKNENMGNINAVFGQISQGLNVTSGLKKVTDDQKTKNRKDRSGKVEIKEQPKKVQKEKPPSKIEFIGGRWVVMHFNEGLQTVDKADMKSTIFINNCDDTTIQIKQKVKSIAIDSCQSCHVYIEEVVSTIEMVNCKSVAIHIIKKAPSVSIEKSQSARIVLSRNAYEACPDIYTSNISAMNIEIPGVKDSDDNVELPVPEQFLSKIDLKTRKLTTTHVTHG